MARYNHFQYAFSFGEISPKYHSRIDIEQFRRGVKTLENFVVMPQGGVTKRPGTLFVAPTRLTGSVRLFKYLTADGTPYILELGEGTMRFYLNQTPIMTSTTRIQNGTFDTNLGSWTTISTGTGTIAWNASGRMDLTNNGAGATQMVTGLGGHTTSYSLAFTSYTGNIVVSVGTTSGGSEVAKATVTPGSNTLTFFASSNTLYFSFQNLVGGTSQIDAVVLSEQYQVGTSYPASILKDLQVTQIKDTLYFAHPSYAPKSLTRTTDTNWTFAATVFTEPPYFDTTHVNYGGIGSNVTTTITGGTAVGNTVTCTGSNSVFVSSDVGRYLRYRVNSTAAWGVIKLTVFNSATSMTGTVMKAFSGTSASNEWQLGAWSVVTGYPACVSAHEDRLVFANTTIQPDTVWASRTGDPLNFQPDSDLLGTQADDVSYTKSAAWEEAVVINWLHSSTTTLFIGTRSGIFVLKGGTNGVTYNAGAIKPTTASSTKNIQPLRSKHSLLYVNLYGKKFQEIAYDLNEEAFKTKDLSEHADHFLLNGVSRMAIQAEPYYVTWVVTTGGELLSYTYKVDSGPLYCAGWAKHTLGGTTVSVKDVLTTTGGTEDLVYLVVSRTINGTTAQYIEYLGPYFEGTTKAAARFLDCAKVYTGAAFSSVTGLYHLTGQTLDVAGDGDELVGTFTGSATGNLTLPKSVTTAVIGLPYTSNLQTLTPEGGSRTGSAQGLPMNLMRMMVRFVNSIGGRLGVDTSNLHVIPWGSTLTYGTGTALFTGDKKIQITSGSNPNLTAYFRHDYPLPCTITGLEYDMEVQE